MAQLLAFVIDDNEVLGQTYKQALQISGFTAQHISDSTQALPLIIEQRPHLIMLDMQMPKMSGEEVLKAIRADERIAGTRVIVVTANHLMAQHAVSQMADLVLQKPASLDQIMHFSKRVLSMRR